MQQCAKEKADLTVVVPIYNVEKYLKNVLNLSNTKQYLWIVLFWLMMVQQTLAVKLLTLWQNNLTT